PVHGCSTIGLAHGRNLLESASHSTCSTHPSRRCQLLSPLRHLYSLVGSRSNQILLPDHFLKLGPNHGQIAGSSVIPRRSNFQLRCFSLACALSRLACRRIAVLGRGLGLQEGQQFFQGGRSQPQIGHDDLLVFFKQRGGKRVFLRQHFV